MKTEKELIELVLSDAAIEERFKTEERRKIQVCNNCPENDNCWSCGVHEWWTYKGKSPAPFQR